VVAKRELDGARLRGVVEHGARAVRVDVTDLVDARLGAVERAQDRRRAGRIAVAPGLPVSEGAVMWCESAEAACPANSARIVAPRARALASDSRISIAAPSPITSPSRSLSKGCGTPSVRWVIAPVRSKAPTPTSMIVASADPAIAASTTPCLMSDHAMPRPSEPDAQAEATEKLGPRAPVWMLSRPPAPFDISLGIMKTSIRRGPALSSVRTASWKALVPPIAELTTTATRSAFSSVIASPDSRP